jgi:hypothetical protein
MIVDALDTNADGDLAASEVKVLFSKLLGIPEADIPDDHEEIVGFVGLSTGGMVEKLSTTVPKEKVDEYYEAMFPAAAAEDDTKVARSLLARAAEAAATAAQVIGGDEADSEQQVEDAAEQWNAQMEASEAAIDAAEAKGKDVEGARKHWRDAAAAATAAKVTAKSDPTEAKKQWASAAAAVATAILSTTEEGEAQGGEVIYAQAMDSHGIQEAAVQEALVGMAEDIASGCAHGDTAILLEIEEFSFD